MILLLAKGAGGSLLPLVFAATLLIVWGWFGAVAELFWALFLRPKLVTGVFIISTMSCLAPATAFLPSTAALVLAALVSPLLAWTLVNLSLWLKCPASELNSPRTFVGFWNLGWRRAFFDITRGRQRQSYVAPLASLDEAEL